MDRRSILLSTLCCLALVLMMSVGCATVSVEPDGHLRDPDIVTAALTDTPQVSDEEVASSIPSSSMPDVSFASPLPSPALERRTPPAADSNSGAAQRRRALADEFHLSADTGWLVLPVPRITDDLPNQVSPRERDLISGLPLILPLPPAAAIPRNTDGAHVEITAGDDTGERAGAAPSPVAAFADGLGQAPAVTRAVTPAAEIPATAEISGSIATSATVDRNAEMVVGPGETEWSRRSAAVDSRADVVITLPGSGWLYVGREYGAGIADLMTKRTIAGDDEFVFQFSESGDYGLWFQRQDVATGRITNERLQVDAAPGGSDRISVLSLAEVSRDAPSRGDVVGPGVAPADLTGPGETWLPGSREGADSSRSVAVQDRAISADGSPVDDPVIGSEPGPAAWLATATEAAERGNVVVAAEYWQRIIAAGGADAQIARASLFELAVGETTGTGASSAGLLGVAVEALRDAGELDRDSLLAAAEAAQTAGLYSDAVVYYAELSEWAPVVAGIDGIYFRLAEILSMPGPSRDLGRARDLYEVVIDRYPLSRHWDDSASRVEYLNRHYFEVR